MIIALSISIIIIIALTLKLISVKRSLREIRTQYKDREDLTSNSLICVSSRDKDVKKLAGDINSSLKKATAAYHKYNEGDAELKASITNLAHDIRTPLTSICGYLNLMEKIDKSEQMERYLKIVSERADFMKNLTEELFEYSVVSGADEEVVLEKASLNRILEDSIMDYYGAITEKGITPIVDITENKIERMINTSHLERVFSNLISNALKYSDKDLVITLDDDGVITFKNTSYDLTNVEVEKLFNRFYTVHTGRNSTGLGLSIAKKFVEEMNGTISASLEDNMLVIRIVFPGDLT